MRLCAKTRDATSKGERMEENEHSEGYLRLVTYLDQKMSMSHIYQPEMLKTLLERNGVASRRGIAAAFLTEDQSQLEYYDEIVKRYPTQTLKRHWLVEHDRGRYSLCDIFTAIDADERAALIAMCDAKLANFVERRQQTPHAVRRIMHSITARIGGRAV